MVLWCFRCGVLLFIVILVLYINIEMGNAFDGVFLCCPFSHEMFG